MSPYIISAYKCLSEYCVIHLMLIDLQSTHKEL